MYVQHVHVIRRALLLRMSLSKCFVFDVCAWAFCKQLLTIYCEKNCVIHPFAFLPSLWIWTVAYLCHVKDGF